MMLAHTDVMMLKQFRRPTRSRSTIRTFKTLAFVSFIGF